METGSRPAADRSTKDTSAKLSAAATASEPAGAEQPRERATTAILLRVAVPTSDTENGVSDYENRSLRNDSEAPAAGSQSGSA